MTNFYAKEGTLLKYVYISLGFVFFALGAIGALVPVLPTTPFLLLASAFFAKGSDKYTIWFHSTKLYKNHLKTFYENRSMTRKTKIFLLTFATTMMFLSLLSLPNIYGKISLALLIVYLHYYFHYRIKTVPPSSKY
ncbi:MAG: DUF454 domain-containing protein [Clostridium sp.]|jgi:uncharacterized membrane protein YbaN (DUF454 family)|nr:DUF454 domain-containing protein [Clostridium sp.]